MEETSCERMMLGARMKAAVAPRTVHAVDCCGLEGSPAAAQHRIIETGPLLEDGRLREAGWAISPVLEYRRDCIAASAWRIKEWDYYLIQDAHYAVAITVSDLAYLGLLSASVLDFETGLFITESVITPMPFGRYRMPESSDSGSIDYECKQVGVHIATENGRRTFKLRYDGFVDGKTLALDAVLDDEPRDSMVIATPWAENDKAFYYNRKIIGMRAEGEFSIGGNSHRFSRDDALGLLDWGRGVWTYDNTWFWAAAQGWQSDSSGIAHRIGFNFGYGFGDTSAASENMVFVDGEATKIGRLDFGIPAADGAYSLMDPWHFVDAEGRIDLEFVPDIDRADYSHVGPVLTDQHQVFGVYSGTVVVDGPDGCPCTVPVDGLRGFAEVVHNKY